VSRLPLTLGTADFSSGVLLRSGMAVELLGTCPLGVRVSERAVYSPASPDLEGEGLPGSIGLPEFGCRKNPWSTSPTPLIPQVSQVR